MEKILIISKKKWDKKIMDSIKIVKNLFYQIKLI